MKVVSMDIRVCIMDEIKRKHEGETKGDGRTVALAVY